MNSNMRVTNRKWLQITSSQFYPLYLWLQIKRCPSACRSRWQTVIIWKVLLWKQHRYTVYSAKYKNENPHPRRVQNHDALLFWPLVAFTMPPRTNVFTPPFWLSSNDDTKSSKMSAASFSSWQVTQGHYTNIEILLSKWRNRDHKWISIFSPSVFLNKEINWGERLTSVISMCCWKWKITHKKNIFPKYWATRSTYIFLKLFFFFLCQLFDWSDCFSFSVCHNCKERRKGYSKTAKYTIKSESRGLFVCHHSC